MNKPADAFPSPSGGRCPAGADEGASAGNPQVAPSPPAPPPGGEGSIADCLRAAATRLQNTLALEPREARLEAQILIARALEVNRAWLVAHDRDRPTAHQQHAIETLIARREAGEPVAYILGEREFYGRTFKVSPDVLIPRPDTELLVEAALERLPPDAPARVLDIGTGSGCIALTLALDRPAWQLTAVDISPSALKIAQFNAAHLGARVDFVQSDLFDNLDAAPFDAIVSNPPYVAAADPHLARGDVRFEPAGALTAGPAGLDVLARLIAQAPGHLCPGGWLLLEHGWDQGDKCQGLMAQSGFMDIQTLTDLAGHPRVTLGRRPR
jgi:release factor glutamine methyltransferase